MRAGAASAVIGGWLLVGELLAQDGDGWRELRFEPGPYDSPAACHASARRTARKALDHERVVQDRRKCVEGSPLPRDAK